MLFPTSALSSSKVFHHPYSPSSSLSLLIVSEMEPVSPDSIKRLSWFFDRLGQPGTIVLLFLFSFLITDVCPWLSVLYLSVFFFTSILITCFHIYFSAEEVHHVSVSINVSHSLLVCGEAWGTDPRFSWLHERAAITQNVGKVSSDGTSLLVTMTPICGHFTCMVSNKRGYSSATYTAGRNSI